MSRRGLPNWKKCLNSLSQHMVGLTEAGRVPVLTLGRVRKHIGGDWDGISTLATAWGT
jgi:hypothetical protein